MTDKQLEEYRKDIDNIDKQILQLLKDRFSIVDCVARYKHKHNLPVFNYDRSLKVIADRETRAYNAGLDPRLISSIYSQIIFYSCLREESIIKQKEAIGEILNEKH